MFPAAALAVLLAAPAPVTAAELAPLLGARAEVEGLAALEEGRYRDAAAKLAASEQPGARFVRALALVEAGRPADALAPLEDLGARLPEIADRLAYLRGLALDAAGRPGDALAAWAAVPDGSLLAAEARLERGRVAARQGDLEGALAALAPLAAAAAPQDASRADHGATALLLSARLREKTDPAAARRDLLACWSEHPLAPEAVECRTALTSLAAPHDAPPGAEDVLRRAEALLDANRNGAALALLGPLVEALPAPGPGEPLACRAHAATGRAHRKERNYTRAIEELRGVVERCEDPQVRVRALYVLASATSIAGDREEAVALYRRLARDFPTHPFADDALFFAADLLARMGRVDEAREALAALAREHPTGDYRDEARFRMAWLSRQQGDVDAAIAQLLVIEEEERDVPYEHARAAYWRARLLAGRGDDGRRAARAIWSDLVARYPTDYYGLLARARLAGRAGDALPSPVIAANVEVEPTRWDAGPVREDPHFAAGVLLLRLGLAKEAAEELGAIDPGRLRSAGQAAPDGVLLVAHLLDRAGDHRAAHNLLRTRARAALRRAPEGENLRAWRIAYPPAYRGDVRRWAPPAGVPVDLVQALMREESALDPRAISPAGAVGLTQLMPATARQVARRAGIGRLQPAKLSDASVNIRLGSRYLGELIRRFDGQVALAVAAYNAGPGAVSRWLEKRPGLDLDEFVEEIPIEETRGYVKRVLRSYAAYRLLYGSDGEVASLVLAGPVPRRL
ncbi:MAG TPA: transglycosylase SLT domain-containing protein [Anaeromyxobacter sp.]